LDGSAQCLPLSTHGSFDYTSAMNMGDNITTPPLHPSTWLCFIPLAIFLDVPSPSRHKLPTGGYTE